MKPLFFEYENQGAAPLSDRDGSVKDSSDGLPRQRVKKIIFLTLFLIASLPIFGQQCREREALDFMDQVRVTYPAALDYDGVKISTVEKSKRRIRPREFLVDEKTEFPVGFEKDYKSGLWLVIYCADSNLVLWVQKFHPQDDLKRETKTQQESRIAKQ